MANTDCQSFDGLAKFDLNPSCFVGCCCFFSSSAIIRSGLRTMDRRKIKSSAVASSAEGTVDCCRGIFGAAGAGHVNGVHNIIST